MGMGQAMRMADTAGLPPAHSDIQNSPMQDLADLKQQAQMLERQKQELDQRIKQIEKETTD
jgi:hypothetical protein